jgi:glycosyltransferase involved in cell wall biosynthesis
MMDRSREGTGERVNGNDVSKVGHKYGRRAGDVVVIESSEPASQPSKAKIVIVIPAYNEDRFVGSVVLKALQQAEVVIVVDDGSTDHTAEVAAAAGAIVVRHGQNQGKGTALNTGFHAAQEYEPQVVVTLDADGQHSPQETEVLVAPILAGEADIVIGSRYLEHSSQVPRSRIWGHRGFNLLTGQLSGVSSTDSQSGFRAFSPRALRAISFSSTGFSVESEMQFLAHEHDLVLVEAPVTISYPDKPKRRLTFHGFMVLNGVLRLVGQYRPLLFFGVPGLVVLLMGIGWGWMVVDIYRRTQQLAVGYAMISVLLTILGSLGLTTGLILHSVRGLMLELLRPQK